MQQILIHGLGQSPSSWNETIERLKEPEKVKCPDLAELLQGNRVDYISLYDAFSKYCHSFSEPLNLCGLSLGGVLALHYGIDHPEKVNSLVLIAAQYRMPEKLLKLQNAMFRFMPESMFRQMGFGKKEFIQLSKSMMKLDFSKELQKLSCPVLIICGEKDKANRRASEELAKYLPHAQMQIVEKAGHEVNLDAPERLAEIWNGFYEQEA